MYDRVFELMVLAMAASLVPVFLFFVWAFVRGAASDEPASPAEPSTATDAAAPATAAASAAVETVPVEAPQRAPEGAARRPDLGRSLEKTRLGFVARIEALLRGREALDPAVLDEIETVLFGADLGVATADQLMQAARAAGSPDEIRPALERAGLEILASVPTSEALERGRPHVILVVGVNGAGKTTSIGKLAGRWVRQGQKVLIAAADTYRAAAVDQLEVWAERSSAGFIRGQPGGDPAAVAFDAVHAGVARDMDVVLIDTAGRLQTDQGLMDELGKIVRVVRKEVPEAPHEVLLVLDATTGQNAIRQAREFTRAVDVTGIVLAKLDGTARGGVVLGIGQEVGLPVRYVGVGEGVDDLCDFDAEDFVHALFAAGADA